MRYKAYKYRIYPNKEQQELINKHIGCCRYVYNLCLEKKINAYKTSKKSISMFELKKLLPILKKEQETSFLKEVNSLSLQAAIINLDNKDYLVRQGDKIIDEKYKVLQINQSWITVSLGSNVYSAGIGELFSKDDLDKTKNDMYHLESRIGGRRS